MEKVILNAVTAVAPSIGEKMFENATVKLDVFLDVFIFGPLKMFLWSSVITVVLFILFKSKIMVKKFPALIFECWKLVIYASLACLVFFYNFDDKEWLFSFQLPEEMLVSTAFVGALAIYESATAVFNIIRILIDDFLQD